MLYVNLNLTDLAQAPLGSDSSLRLSEAPNLEILNISGCSLTELDLSKNTELEDLDLTNTELTELDLSNNRKLASLDCSDNGISSLTLPADAKISSLDCRNNAIGSIDAETIRGYVQNDPTFWLACSGNKLSADNVAALQAVYDEGQLGTDWVLTPQA